MLSSQDQEPGKDVDAHSPLRPQAGSPHCAIRKEKEIKGMRIGKKEIKTYFLGIHRQSWRIWKNKTKQNNENQPKNKQKPKQKLIQIMSLARSQVTGSSQINSTSTQHQWTTRNLKFQVPLMMTLKNVKYLGIKMSYGFNRISGMIFFFLRYK